MQSIPRDDTFDVSLALLKDGYRFISRRCAHYNTDAFRTRIMLRPVTCVMGEDAARMFYEPGRFTRKMSMPPMTLMSLQDVGSVMTLDGAAHEHRKKMFMSLMGPDSLGEIVSIFERNWRDRLSVWEQQPGITLHHEVEELLCRTVCEWAGIALQDAEVRDRTRELSAMIAGAGAVGPRNWKGLALRARTEHWARDLVDQVRAVPSSTGPERPIEILARHREPNGELLSTKTAAIELLNLLRPTLAVARFVTFIALALHRHPDYRDKLLQDEARWLEPFVQEVRRFYPFFPLIAGNATEAFDWRGEHFSKGSWVVLDIYGTNHDPRIWDQPTRFQPERFEQWNQSPYNFLPQGGGEFFPGHRCAGEWMTVELMKSATRLLTKGMSYEVVPQDLSIDMSRMPAIPQSRFIISQIKRTD
ncbi:cytochrome P450 [Pseudomonas sp. OIL-1]|uniref:cytochrome P450 n=1 Tax=Pseudomonas sp. OIL-1 TaxID=2706126 RepID=UPI0013A73780|nr:cytochrome P450 [Pseudomonas sp. OIL-1]QIB52690.1 cytochrome P450 [Pseudomonas sp. OIL-1]